MSAWLATRRLRTPGSAIIPCLAAKVNGDASLDHTPAGARRDASRHFRHKRFAVESRHAKSSYEIAS